MNEIKLPPLPEPTYRSPSGTGNYFDGYTKQTLQAYATAAIEADRKRQPRVDTETLKQLNEVLQYLENEVMKLEAAYGHNFKPHATKKARATVEKLKAAMSTISKRTAVLISVYQEKIRALEADNYSLVSDLDDRQARGEPIYAFRRKGLTDFSTCTKERFYELSDNRLFETRIFYNSPQPPQIPVGYALVPVEPTPEMLEAGWVGDEVSLRQRYKAMLEAAPKPKGRT